jgi:transcriptional regulator with XRE-family HTH domain
MPTIGNELRKARVAKQLTQAELELMSGVSTWKIQIMESDDGSDCRIDDLLSIVGVLGVPLGGVIRHPRREGPWVAPRA